MSLCVIPARGGSKRIPRKNVRPFFGKPMIVWSIEAALASNVFDHVIVTTDDPEIAEVARVAGAEVPFMRPANLSDDATPTVPVIAHAVDEAEALWGPQDFVCCLYATAPFVLPEDIRKARLLLDTTEADYAFPVTSFPFPIQRGVYLRDDGRMEMFHPEHALTRSQDLEEAYHDVGQFYWGRKAAWLAGKTLIGPDAAPLIIPRSRAQDIDTPEDWDRAEQLFAMFQHSRRKVLFRADAGRELGVGHVMRCLTLADEIDGQATFVCKDIDGHLEDVIAARGHVVHLLDAGLSAAEDAAAVAGLAQGHDLVVMDHYGLGADWSKAMPAPVMVLDDVADRAHDCAVLLDQNLGREASDYNGLVPDGAVRLIGPEYALLRPEFASYRTASLARRAEANGAVKRLLISLGGGDMQSVVTWILDVLRTVPGTQYLSIDIILGAAAKSPGVVQSAAEDLPCAVQIHSDVDNMAEHMAGADLMIGAGGSTSWERCALGLPVIVLPLADNQIPAVTAMAKAGMARAVKPHDDDALRAALEDLFDNPDQIVAMSAAAAAACDGKGAARVAAVLSDMLTAKANP
ncbi:pseudaminic acid cytidylyltransferase [Rhodobacteraceae bacterium N5(2021)]|uniref:Pseudaminic acid cytidylyltransferase n=1 Tax=Gymnodinialimonas phycosphaerae TaxID=2841589 RepID=A0A975YEA5_9RHOB|nr:pseudaminic acid cytidylyltransferase [Gymnodinialimonas phycosphaerae]MBY4893444.1 pseudaminic acid cytidylyltransferase [Gymnodinialimonas phycosphaerae]